METNIKNIDFLIVLGVPKAKMTIVQWFRKVSWVPSGIKWGPRGNYMGPSGNKMGTNWDQVGTKWDQIGTKWGPIGTKWGPNGTQWGPSGTNGDQVGTKRDQVGNNSKSVDFSLVLNDFFEIPKLKMLLLIGFKGFLDFQDGSRTAQELPKKQPGTG